MGLDGHLTGVGWRESALHFELRGEGDKALVAVAAGDEVALEVVGKRSCIGYRAPGSGTLTPCPHDAQGSASQCPSCLTEAAILPCHRCTGERCTNSARRSACVRPRNHAVYLAAFGPDTFKVGVARWDRRFERLAEQGARVALIIAREDGQQARRLESQFKFASIPDRLAPTDKLRALAQPATPQALEAALRTAFEQTKIRVIGQWLREPHVVELPAAPEGVLSSVPRLLKAKDGDGLRLRGHVRAVCGQLLVIDTDMGERVAVEASSLIGYRLRALADEEGGVGQMAMSLL
jgi:hypothetical protein